MGMRGWLVTAAILWPALLTAATAERIRGEAPAFTTAIYVMASRVCHQRPERSFHTRAVSWPVCGRCSGLYLSAPIGALAAFMVRRRGPGVPTRRLGPLLGIAAVPTILTVALEWSDLTPMTSFWRALAALPLGAMAAWIIVTVAPGRPSEAIR